MKIISTFSTFLLFVTSICAEFRHTVTSGNNVFAADLYSVLSRSSEQNFIFSPFSAESVLAFAQSGARGLTAEELRTRLHLPNDQNQIEESFQDLHKTLKSQKGYSFHTANKLYLKDNFNVKNDFKRVAQSVFDSEIERIDFLRRDEASNYMNQWVEKKTNDKIHGLITPDKLGPDTRAILINALYFNGNWSTPFRKRSTEKRNFYTLNNQAVEVDMMSMREDSRTFNYAENPKIRARFLELPFQGKEVTMTFVLPFPTTRIDQLEGQIHEVFSSQDFSRQYINMTIPKFKSESKIDVKEILENLGVNKAFSPADADFSGISDSRIFISDVIQKTFIDVHESGVEAAAATYAGFALLSIQSTPEYIQFHLDQPFIYFIKVKDLIVFAGRVGVL